MVEMWQSLSMYFLPGLVTGVNLTFVYVRWVNDRDATRDRETAQLLRDQHER